ncbi:unnamed protein product, partial [Meganyctiphanes norvegica]
MEGEKLKPVVIGKAKRPRAFEHFIDEMEQRHDLDHRVMTKDLQNILVLASRLEESLYHFDILNPNSDMRAEMKALVKISDQSNNNCVRPCKSHIIKQQETNTLDPRQYIGPVMHCHIYLNSTRGAIGPLKIKNCVIHTVIANNKMLLPWPMGLSVGHSYINLNRLFSSEVGIRILLLTQTSPIKEQYEITSNTYNIPTYSHITTGPVPVKWMALESLRDGVFSTQSDVWAYGVVLWEIFALGQNPYAGVDFDGDFIKKLEKGIRLEQPKYATYELYNLMLKCWEEDPLSRPSFSDIENELGAMIGQTERQYYLDLNQPYQFENTASTFLARLASPDYAARNRESTPTSIDLEGYEIPSDPAASAMPLLVGTYGGPIQPFASTDSSAGAYIPMCSSIGSPSPTKSDVPFNFDTKEYSNDNTQIDQIQIHTFDKEPLREDEGLSEYSPFTEEAYIVMEQSNNDTDAENKTKQRLCLDLKNPPRAKHTRHDSGVYSPTTPPSLQTNPSYMTMSFSNIDENKNITKNELSQKSETNKPPYLNLKDTTEIMKYPGYGNIYQEDHPTSDKRSRSGSEVSSGVGSIIETPAVFSVK